MADESYLDKAERWIHEMTGTGDYATPTKRRANDVDRGISTYKGKPNGQGAAQNTVDAIKAHKKALDDL